MINNNYAQTVAQARANNISFVSFDNNNQSVQPIPGQKDTVTLSDKAIAMMNGADAKEVVPTYVKPQTANSLLAQHNSSKLDNENNIEEVTLTANRFSEIMQKIVDQRLGVDRKKLEEIDAMMEEIAKNEGMSPEEKQQALEMLTELREKVINESRDIQKIAKQNEQQS